MAVKGMAIFGVWMGLISYSESPYCQKPSIKFLNKRIYGLEEDYGWRIPRCLDSAWKSLMSEWGDFSYFWVSYCRKHSINFLIKRIYGWQKMLVEEFQDGCLVHGHLWCVNGMILDISEFPYCQKTFIKFLIKRIYGLEEDVGWRIPRWLFSAWPSLMNEWDEICYFWVAMLWEAFLKFLLKRIYGLKGDGG